jgi:tetratricopeptide (TPR) repeat protein
LLRANTFSNLGAAFRSLGEDARAKASYEAALQLAPESAHAYVGLGLLAQKAGEFNHAAELYAKAMAIQPTDIGYVLLAKAFQQAGDSAEAQTALESARRLSPNLQEAQQAADRLLTQ